MQQKKNFTNIITKNTILSGRQKYVHLDIMKQAVIYIWPKVSGTTKFDVVQPHPEINREDLP